MNILSQLMDESTRLPAIIALLYRVPAVLIALTLHELAHGYVALRCGDPTAQMMGRLSFNPLRHLHPIGTIMMFLFGFGFARPVPVNSRNFRNYRRDDLLVSLAGVTANFLLFFFSTLLLFGLNQLLWKPEIWAEASQREFLRADGLMNYLFYQILNPPQELSYGFSQLMRTPWLIYAQRFLMVFSMINLSLCLFNLLPIPPFDGYHVFNDIFLRGKLHVSAKVVSVLVIAVFALFYFSSFASRWLGQAVYFVQGSVSELILWIFGLG